MPNQPFNARFSAVKTPEPEHNLNEMEFQTGAAFTLMPLAPNDVALMLRFRRRPEYKRSMLNNLTATLEQFPKVGPDGVPQGAAIEFPTKDEALYVKKLMREAAVAAGWEVGKGKGNVSFVTEFREVKMDDGTSHFFLAIARLR